MLGRFSKAFGIARGWATAAAQAEAPAVDFALTGNSVVTGWGVAVVGDLLPSNAPAGSFFVLVGEPAGLAVVNG